VGSSLNDIRKLPEEAKDVFGFALDQAQLGDKHMDAKPLKGFGGAGVLEIVADEAGNTFRAVYTVKLPSAVYVLHVFQKKSTRGAKTPQREIDLVKARWAAAMEHYKEHYEQQK
jgi:phage-related protein